MRREWSGVRGEGVELEAAAAAYSMRTINIESYLRSLIITWLMVMCGCLNIAPMCKRYACASVSVATVHPRTSRSAMHHSNEPSIACRSVLRIYNPSDGEERLMYRLTTGYSSTNTRNNFPALILSLKKEIKKGDTKLFLTKSFFLFYLF